MSVIVSAFLLSVRCAWQNIRSKSIGTTWAWDWSGSSDVKREMSYWEVYGFAVFEVFQPWKNSSRCLKQSMNLETQTIYCRDTIEPTDPDELRRTCCSFAPVLGYHNRAASRALGYGCLLWCRCGCTRRPLACCFVIFRKKKKPPVGASDLLYPQFEDLWLENCQDGSRNRFAVWHFGVCSVVQAKRRQDLCPLGPLHPRPISWRSNKMKQNSLVVGVGFHVVVAAAVVVVVVLVSVCFCKFIRKRHCMFRCFGLIFGCMSVCHLSKPRLSLTTVREPLTKPPTTHPRNFHSRRKRNGQHEKLSKNSVVSRHRTLRWRLLWCFRGGVASNGSTSVTWCGIYPFVESFSGDL